MKLPPRMCLAVLLLLPPMVLAAEPAPTGVPPAAAAVAATPSPTTEDSPPESRTLARAFDLRGGAVRSVIRATAATQSSSGVRMEPIAQPKPDLAAALIVEHPVPRPESTPRVPERPKRCNGFWSCGLETLLGLHDHDYEDEQRYARQERERLMNQGSFTDKSGCAACNSPGDPNRALRGPDGEGAPIRP